MEVGAGQKCSFNPVPFLDTPCYAVNLNYTNLVFPAYT
jgi:hypothetical protein